MIPNTTQLISLRDFDNKKTTQGTLTIKYFTLTQRVTRAVKFFVIFFGLALFSALIPVLHFVLVPAFCLAAVGSAGALFMQKDQIDIATGICPYCDKETKLPKAKLAGEFRDTCEHCLQLVVATTVVKINPQN